MAITDNAIVVTAVPNDGVTWAMSMYSTDVSGVEVIKAGVTGECHYVMKISMNSSAAMTATLGAGEAVAGTMDNAYIGPVAFTAAGPNFDLDFTEIPDLPLKGMKCPVGLPLCIDGTAGNIAIYIEGKTCKEPPL
jgi:hypothetical protein